MLQFREDQTVIRIDDKGLVRIVSPSIDLAQDFLRRIIAESKTKPIVRAIAIQHFDEAPVAAFISGFHLQGFLTGKKIEIPSSDPQPERNLTQILEAINSQEEQPQTWACIVLLHLDTRKYLFRVASKEALFSGKVCFFMTPIRKGEEADEAACRALYEQAKIKSPADALLGLSDYSTGNLTFKHFIAFGQKDLGWNPVLDNQSAKYLYVGAGDLRFLDCAPNVRHIFENDPSIAKFLMAEKEINYQQIVSDILNS